MYQFAVVLNTFKFITNYNFKAAHKNLIKSNMQFLELYNGYKIPALGLGTWQATDDELENTMERALEIGYRHFDTAILYENEKVIGSVLNKWLDAGKIKREEIFITTKLPPTGLYSEKVEHYLKTSLENLKLDYVDLYLIHSPDGIKNNPIGDDAKIKEPIDIKMDKDVDHISVWKELEKQVDAGRTKSIGLSNFSINQIKNILENCRLRPSNLQIELHVYCQQKELVNFCKSNQISVVAYSPLGSPGLNNFYASYGQTKDLPNLFKNETVGLVAQKYNKTPAQILLRHTIQRGLGAIPKTTNLDRLKENINIFDFTLDDEDINNLDKLDLGISGRVTDWESWTW